MKTLCVYYTRSGRTGQLADQIAKTLDADLLSITNGKDYSGVLGYVRAAFCGLKKKMPPLLPKEPPLPLAAYDRIVVAAPIWCEDVCILMRAFLCRNRESLKGELYYVIGHMSRLSYEEKIRGLSACAGKEAAGFLSLQTEKNDPTAELAAFLQTLC